jgi:hypothetical protein
LSTDVPEDIRRKNATRLLQGLNSLCDESCQEHHEFPTIQSIQGSDTEGFKASGEPRARLLATFYLLRREGNGTWSNGALRRMSPDVVANVREVAAAREFNSLAGSDDAQQCDGATGAV